MTEQDKRESVDFDSVYFEITSRVSALGTVGNIEDWKKAFPDFPFEEVDENFTGEEIDWNKRTIEEKTFYVAFMTDPQAAKVDYVMDVDGTQLRRKIDDSEKIWYMWMDGCFTGEKELDETAIKALLWFLDDSVLARRFIEDMDLADVKLLSLSGRLSTSRPTCPSRSSRSVFMARTLTPGPIRCVGHCASASMFGSGSGIRVRRTTEIGAPKPGICLGPTGCAATPAGSSWATSAVPSTSNGCARSHSRDARFTAPPV